MTLSLRTGDKHCTAAYATYEFSTRKKFELRPDGNEFVLHSVLFCSALFCSDNAVIVMPFWVAISRFSTSEIISQQIIVTLVLSCGVVPCR